MKNERKEFFMRQISGFVVDGTEGAHVLAVIVHQTIQQLGVIRVLGQKTLRGTVNHRASLWVALQELQDHLYF